MSFAERARGTGSKIVTLDIERMRGRAEVEFWNLDEYKNKRIHASDVVEWPRTILVCWKQLDQARVHWAAEWQDGGPEAMFRAVWHVYDEADIIVGHNIKAFDTKHLNTAWRDLGLPMPSPPKTVDTLTVARQQFGDESKTLDALTTRLGLVGKTDRYDVETARKACAGVVASQTKLRRYCQGDVLATEALYLRLQGWMPGHPHNKHGTIDDRMTCNQCWGNNLTRIGTKLAQQITYIMYRCDDCGAPVQGVRHNRAALTRGARP